MTSEKLVLCLGFPAFHDETYLSRLRTLDGVDAVVLPIDPGGNWAEVDQAEPVPEPPPWAIGVQEQRRAVLARAHGLVALHAPDRLLERAPELRWVQCIGAGVEQFARAGVRRDRVVVTNASGVSSASMGEWVVGRLLQVWKRLREADDHQRAGEFVRTYGRTFAGATVGIVGLGSIGRSVAERVRPFGCRVLGMRRSSRAGDTSDHADALYGPDQLHEMIGLCDAVVIAAPATPETKNLIDAKALDAMPTHSVLVNVARGSLLDEDALAVCLRAGGIAAAVLDVFAQEPLPKDSPLWTLPNVYVSAHSSVSLDRYMQDVFELVCENARRLVAGEPLRNAVDMEQLGFD